MWSNAQIDRVWWHVTKNWFLFYFTEDENCKEKQREGDDVLQEKTYCLNISDYIIS